MADKLISRSNDDDDVIPLEKYNGTKHSGI